MDLVGRKRQDIDMVLAQPLEMGDVLSADDMAFLEGTFLWLSRTISVMSWGRTMPTESSTGTVFIIAEPI